MTDVQRAQGPGEVAPMASPDDVPEGLSAPGAAGEPGEPHEEPLPPAVVWRRAFRVVMPLAVLAVLLAVAVNWVFVPGAGQALPSPDLGIRPPVPGAVTPAEPARPALDLVPKRILQFEPITVQAIPGMEDYAAEAVYKTLEMNIEAQIPTVVYARVEVYGSADEARSRLAEFMAPYTSGAGQTLIGTATAQYGWAPDKSSYARGWVRDTYMTFVKASFSEFTPAHSFEIIERQGIMVSEAVESFQRTGLQGVSAE